MRIVFLAGMIMVGLMTLPACRKSKSSGDGGGGAGPGARPSAASGTMAEDKAKSIAAEDGSASQFNGSMSPYKKTDTTPKEISPPETLKFRQPAGLKYLNQYLTMSDQECEPTESGDTTDADGDEVPVAATQNYNCNIEMAEFFQFKMTMTGSAHVTDEDDTVAFPGKGATWVFNQFKMNMSMGAGDGGETMLSTDTLIDGTHKISVDGTNQATLDITMLTTTKMAGGEDGENVDIATKQWGTIVVTPDDKNNPDAGGDTSIDAYLGLEAANEDPLTLKVTSSDLRYGCPTAVNILSDEDDQPWIKSGTITYEDGANNKLSFTWTNCEDTPTAKYNDTAI